LHETPETCRYSLPYSAASYRPAADDGYGYPISGSYEATILGTPDNLKPPPLPRYRSGSSSQRHPGPQEAGCLFYDEGLRCTLAYQDKKAPLVFLIGGTGAGDRSQKVMAMMKELYKAGYHVITLPSPTHPNFIISASNNHVPAI